MNKNILNIYKPLGISCGQVIERLRAEDKYGQVSLSYAGRLDPAASGVILVLVGDEVKKQEQWKNLEKEYIAKILFGFSTDTYDFLGMIDDVIASEAPACRRGRKQSNSRTEDNSHEKHFQRNKKIAAIAPQDAGLSRNDDYINKVLQKFIGDFTFSVPPYSSVRVNGRALWQWAKSEEIDKIKIPKRTTKIKEIELLGLKEIDSVDLLSEILEKINLVQGNFRQEEIKNKWRKILQKNKNQYQVASVKVLCSSGTYIRSLAFELGKKQGTPACLLGLERTRVGDFNITGSQKLFD